MPTMRESLPDMGIPQTEKILRKGGDIMSESMRDAIINKDLRPAYCDDFLCLVTGCRLSCCKEYREISFNKKGYLSLMTERFS